MSFNFRVENYNMLVPHWAEQEKPSLKALPWNQRKETLSQRMQRCQPDLICLQEVENFDEIQNCMQRTGYQGCFAKRNNGEQEGCAIFYNAHKFDIVNSQVEFFNDGTGRMVQCLDLQPKDTAQCIHVLNSHAVWDKDSVNRRLSEIRKLQQIAEQKSQTGDPTIVCGDLNTARNEGNIFFEGFTQSGFIDTLHKAGNAWQNTFVEKDSSGNKYFTTYDYIFAKNLNLTGAAVDGDPNDLKADIETGSLREPSDHLPMYADFSLAIKQDNPILRTVLKFEQALRTDNDDILKDKFHRPDEVPANLKAAMKWGFWLFQGMPEGDGDYGQTFFDKNPHHSIVFEVIQFIKDNGLNVLPTYVKEEIASFAHLQQDRNASHTALLAAFNRLNPLTQRVIKVAFWVKAGSPIDRGHDFAGDEIRKNCLDSRLTVVLNLLKEKIVS
jgi:exonuclease III